MLLKNDSSWPLWTLSLLIVALAGSLAIWGPNENSTQIYWDLEAGTEVKSGLVRSFPEEIRLDFDFPRTSESPIALDVVDFGDWRVRLFEDRISVFSQQALLLNLPMSNECDNVTLTIKNYVGLVLAQASVQGRPCDFVEAGLPKMLSFSSYKAGERIDSLGLKLSTVSAGDSAEHPRWRRLSIPAASLVSVIFFQILRSRKRVK